MSAIPSPKTHLTKKAIRLAYGMSARTFVKRLHLIPGFYQITEGRRLLSQAEADLIFKYWGRPKGY